VITSPAGATATLDGRREAACSTPCSLDAAPPHAVSIALAGYQPEHRDLTVGSEALELPMVILRAAQGTSGSPAHRPARPSPSTASVFPQTTPRKFLCLPERTASWWKRTARRTPRRSKSAMPTKVLKVSLNQ